MAAPFLSRDDIEQIAQKILSIYSDAYVPKNHMFYTVEPELLAEVLGIAVDYQMGEHIGTLSKKYTPNKYESFCRLAEALGASKSALSFRMEDLGLLDRNLLYK